MKNFVVIGGSSGIGKSLAEILAEQYTVYASFNTNQTVSDKITYFHYNHEQPLNNENLPNVIHGLIYCPGAISLKPFGRISRQTFLEDYNLQVAGAIDCIQQLLPALKASGNASIVLFSTVAVQKGFNFHSLVSASKGAIEGLTKALAAELAPSIRVNCLAPSLTQTPLAASLINTEEKIESNARRHPLKRIGQPEDISKMTAFLLSDDASWITGQIIHIDGGMSTINF
jgi:NAD(P)-dependent dehydrogenase (short-subunit alcohol dehydrogenase family)